MVFIIMDKEIEIDCRVYVTFKDNRTFRTNGMRVLSIVATLGTDTGPILSVAT